MWRFIFIARRGLIALLCCLSTVVSAADAQKWRGYGVVGNGRVCAVYSDDPKILAGSSLAGLRSLFYKDFSVNYVRESKFAILDRLDRPIPNKALDDTKLLDTKGYVIPNAKAGASITDIISKDRFFAPYTRSALADGGVKETRAFVGEDDAVIMLLGYNGAGKSAAQAQFQLRFRTDRQAMQSVSFEGLSMKGGVALARWSNKVVVGVASMSGAIGLSGGEVVFVREAVGSARKEIAVMVVLGDSEQDVFQKVATLRKKKNMLADAEAYWNAWLDRGKIPFSATPEHLEAYKRNLYAARASLLGGQVPMDLTGQYDVNEMPQLSPRDAMMTARAFLLTQHADEVKDIIKYWANVKTKPSGEWYSSYDALNQPASGGTRIDQPEWDANGYFIKLADEYRFRRRGEWLVEKTFIYKLADFIVNNLDKNGLLYEINRSEWRGYLPTTNMVNASALRTAGAIADEFGDLERAQLYRETADKISSALALLYDTTRKTYVNVRYFAPKGMASSANPFVKFWDTSTNFGVLWGYPNHKEIQRTNEFYLANAQRLNGGLQYLETTETGFANYGSDVYHATTAAAAEYHALQGQRPTALKLIDWMLKNSNAYGLMPERILASGTDCGDASPHTWSMAEFAAAIWTYYQTERPFQPD